MKGQHVGFNKYLVNISRLATIFVKEHRERPHLWNELRCEGLSYVFKNKDIMLYKKHYYKLFYLA